MTISALRIRWALLALPLLASASNAPARGPRDVLSAARSAAGDLGRLSGRGFEMTGSVAAGGLTGRWIERVDFRTSRFEEHSDFGPVALGSVYDGRVRWSIDRSGGVHALNGRFASADAVTDSWLARLQYLVPGAGGAAIGAVSAKARDGRTFDVFTVTPRGGTRAELWFDRETHLLGVVERRKPLTEETILLSDYRRELGVMLPHHIETLTDASDPDQTLEVEAYRAATPAALDAIRAPPMPADTTIGATSIVPIENDSYIVVSAMLNDKGPFDFILDTGAHNIVTPDVARTLGLSVVGKRRSGGAGAETLLSGDTTINDVRLGGATMRRQHFYVIPLQYSTIERGARPPLAGMLGLETFERLNITIDYRRLRLELRGRNRGAACAGRAVPITFDDDMPLANGRILGRPGVIAIDSGNAGSTVVQGVWARKAGLAAMMRKGIPTVSFGTGGQSPNWIMRGGTVALGSVSLRGIDLRLAEDSAGAFSSITEAANVGQQILARFRVTFDYAGGRMCLVHVPGYTPPPLNRAGMVVTKRTPQAFEIVAVTPGAPAAIAGVRQGASIVRVNGRDTSAMSNVDLQRLMRGAPGSTLNLTVMQDGVRSERMLTLRDPG